MKLIDSLCKVRTLSVVRITEQNLMFGELISVTYITKFPCQRIIFCNNLVAHGWSGGPVAGGWMAGWLVAGGWEWLVAGCLVAGGRVAGGWLGGWWLVAGWLLAGWLTILKSMNFRGSGATSASVMGETMPNPETMLM